MLVPVHFQKQKNPMGVSKLFQVIELFPTTKILIRANEVYGLPKIRSIAREVLSTGISQLLLSPIFFSSVLCTVFQSVFF